MPQLTAAKVRSIKKPGRHGDGAGLYLNVTASGSKSWVQRIVIDGRRRDIGLGGYPAVSLADARSLAVGHRTAIAKGLDPVVEKHVDPPFPPFGKPPARPIRPTFRVGAIRGTLHPGCKPWKGTPSPFWGICRLTG